MAAPKGACLFLFVVISPSSGMAEKIRSIWIPSDSVFNFLPLDLCATAKTQLRDTYFSGGRKNAGRVILFAPI
jgi:hypothetical protein